MNKKECPEIDKLIDHLFRHEAGKMVSVLSRIFGPSNLELAEDVVQETMVKALTEWKFNNVPSNPSAWLYQVAKNKAIDIIRREKHFRELSPDIAYLLKSEWTLSGTINNLFLESEIKDSQLRMFFACCHPQISFESQIALTLKTLCGFSIEEVAKAFLSSNETINKRLVRARQKIRDEKISLEIPVGDDLTERLNSVLKAIYLLFNEGYNSNHQEILIRKELCEEAIRLCKLLSDHPYTAQGKVFALLALMSFQSARFDARQNEQGEIILLKDQDRNKWDKELINEGMDYLNKSAIGEELSEYHLEAAIAAQYSVAKDHNSINWNMILDQYDLLLQMKDSPVIRMNRAIVLAEVNGPKAAINELNELQGMEDHYLYHSILGELYNQINEYSKANDHFIKAMKLTSSKAEQELLRRKMSDI